MNTCQICEVDLSSDLFACVAQEPVCAICKMNHIGGARTSPELIARARNRLGLKEGEYLKQDRGDEAARILGRNR